MNEMQALTNNSMGINLSALIAHMTFIHWNIMRHQSQDFRNVLNQGKRLHDKELRQLKDVVTIH
jgi:hypothetical protein